MNGFRAARPGRVALLLPVLMASACASVPNLGAKPAPHNASDYAAAASIASTDAAWPADGWWLRYGDPQLNRLMDEALLGSPDLEAAAARMRTAEGFAQRAGAALKPTVDAFAEPELAKQSQNQSIPASAIPNGWNSSGSLGLSFSLDLDLWGKNRAAFRAANADADAAKFELDEARLALTTGVAGTYADLASLYAQRDTLVSALDIRTQTAKLVSQRVNSGLDTNADLKQAVARVSQARADIEATDEAIELTKHALAALIGAGPDRGISIDRPAIGQLRAQGVPANASVDLVGRRPEIAAARSRVEAANDRIKEAKAAFYPNVNLSALIGLSSFGLGNVFSSGSGIGSVAPAVSLPLFHGGAFQGQYRGRRGQYDEAVALYDRQVIAALRETADAVTSQKKLVSRLANSRSALADFEEANRLARQRYEHGLSTYLDVLSAEEGVLGARLDVAQLETRAFTLDVQLIRALGGGFTAA
ncbi:efflux transporter outer membrane subunit [Sphingomonas sp. SM33]|uniref:Efflux transporter outer membrane subunit n=1 Tax=Sphingomonas telluris TaxID=2907998 RepID=A0ABS9VR90_9SPHN|nr:efflux transporter outer membrane subunit [Sphingomonas telluris]MCH8617468.1 efflux transporter outer membrane subunit [Sphingomonas telluris]